MPKTSLLPLLVLIAAAAGPAVAAAEPRSFEGSAYVYTDARDRIAIVLDQAPPDGRPDLLVVFTPVSPVPGGIRAVTVDGFLRLTETTADFTARDGSMALALAVATDRAARGGAVVRTGNHVHALGVGFRVLESTNWSKLPRDLDLDDPSGARISGEGAELLKIFCAGGRVGKDDDCTSGGPGAYSAQKTCAGFGPVRGESGTANCGPDTYACAYCKGPFAFASCRTSTCSCFNGEQACVIN